MNNNNETNEEARFYHKGLLICFVILNLFFPKIENIFLLNFVLSLTTITVFIVEYRIKHNLLKIKQPK